MNSKTTGHGYFRKSKAFGLVCGIALAGSFAIVSHSVSADDVTTTTPISAPSVATQPVSTNDNDAYAKTAGTSTGTETVTVDNSSVDAAAKTATSTGVDVSKTATVDEGTATNSADLTQAKDTIAKDQAQQVKDIDTATQTQSANNASYVDAQTAINNNNDYVAGAKDQYSSETTVTVSNDSSTSTNGTAQANEAAKVTAQQTLDNNKAAVNDYIIAKENYDATVSQAATLNSAVEAAVTELKNKGVTITTTTKVVSSVAEVEALQQQNAAAIAEANQQVTLNVAILAAYDETKAASDKANSDADTKATDLKGSGVTVNTTTKVVSSVEEANLVASQNQSAYDQAKQKQADWQKQYDDLQSKTGTEGYTKQVVLQALNMAEANPQATHGSTAPGAQIIGTRDIGSTTGNSGYARILDSTGVFKYADVGAGWSTEIDYTNLQGLTVSTDDGQTHDITRIHRTFALINNGATGLNDVYIPNDPTEGFVVARNNGTDNYSDYMNFLVTDSYYYTVAGQEVAFTASEKAPIALTYSSLNNNPIGREGARSTGDGSSMVEINGSTVSVHSDNFAYSDNYNRVEETGVNWDTTDSPYQYKGAAIGVFTSGNAFTTEFVQWDGPADSGGQTYWFAINTRVVAPVIETPTSAQLTKTTVDPVTIEPVSAELVKASNPEKPTLELTSLSNTQNKTVSATYHDYKLAYAPTVSKTVSDTDGTNTDGKTIAKGDSEKYTLVHDNVYANIKVGDVIKIVDPLEAGAIANISETLADATKKGWTVSYDTASETFTLTVTYQGQKFESPIVLWNPEYDNGYYDNTYRVFVNGYEAYSNTVSNRTPIAPIPVKTITDTSSKDINGSTVFDKNVVFGLTTDYTPYTKVTAPSEAIGKGFAIMDDVQDGAFTVNEDGITLTAADKTNVKDLFTMYHVLSDSARTDAINAILAQDGLSPTGEFYLWVAKDPASFYTNYVKAGKNITVSLPSTLNVPAGTPVVNDFYQIDFGNSYLSNKVVVQVPDVSPQKHALDAKDNKIVLDGQEVAIGDYIDYLLDGVTVPVNHDTLWQYDGIDNLDLTHDQYTGNWKGVIKGTEYTAKSDLVLGYDVTTEDGTVIKAGDTIPTGTKYQFSFEFDQSTNSDFINKVVTVTWNAETGRWAYTINKDFLNSLGVKGTFDADFYVEVQRIAAGDVVNTFVNIVNGREMTAEVTTHTPAPVSPETPSSPVQLTDNVQKASVLPETGDKGSILAIIGGMLLTGIGLFGARKRKEN